MDIYRTDHLRTNDIVIDIGAGIGDFSVIASKTVGKGGKVIAIEPNVEDFQLLLLNIKENDCDNVVPINLGVSKEAGAQTLTFLGRTFSFKAETLNKILHELNINDKINFIKMDVEGFEKDIISSNIGLIKDTRVISMEFHGTKEDLDKIILPWNFKFKPITSIHVYRKIIRNLFFHPNLLCQAYINMKINNPNIMSKVIRGIDIVQGNFGLVVGSYFKT